MYYAYTLVSVAKCSACDLEVKYDGGEDAILNMGTCLVSYDLLRTYLHVFLNGRYMYIHACANIMNHSINCMSYFLVCLYIGLIF